MTSIQLVQLSAKDEVSKYKNVSSGMNAKDRLEKTLNHWNGNYKFLLKNNTVIFTEIKNDNLVSIETVYIMKQLLALNLIESLESFIPLGHKAFTFLEFTSAEAASKFKKKYISSPESLVYYVQLEPPSKIINIIIEKLPVSVLNEYLQKILAEWGTIISISPTKMALFNGSTCNSGSNKVLFKLKTDVSVNNLPYFIKIENLKVYLHIPNRPKICFRCQTTTHLVSQCLFKFCQSCRVYKDPLHTCVQTYASKLSNQQGKWNAMLQQVQEEMLVQDLSVQYDSTTMVEERENTALPIILDPLIVATLEEKSIHEVEELAQFSGCNDSESVSKERSGDIKSVLEDSIQSANTPLGTTNECATSGGQNLPKIVPLTISSTKSKRGPTESTLQRNVKKKSLNEPVKTYQLRGKEQQGKFNPKLKNIDSLNGIEISSQSTTVLDNQMDFESAKAGSEDETIP